MINLNDTTPTAVTGGNNVHWQEDASGNVSAYTMARKVAITPTAGVLTLNAALADSYVINVNAAITSMSITNPTDGQELTLLWVQDSTGHAVTVASNLFMGSLTVTTTANKHTCQRYLYNAVENNWYALGQNNM